MNTIDTIEDCEMDDNSISLDAPLVLRERGGGVRESSDVTHYVKLDED